jgi:3-oxoacyl-[acyl-carrier-protein] synthase-3
VGSETLSRICNWQDRATCVLFGDGAAAAVMTFTDDSERGLLYHELGCDGGGAEHIVVPAGGSRMPASKMSVAENLHTIRMNGREVYKFAVKKFNELIDHALEATGLKPEDFDLIIPHQSNLRIINSVMDKMGLSAEKFAINIDRWGNTSSASVGLALDEERRAGRAQPGDLVVLIAFGAGLTWGILVFRM